MLTHVQTLRDGRGQHLLGRLNMLLKRRFYQPAHRREVFTSIDLDWWVAQDRMNVQQQATWPQRLVNLSQGATDTLGSNSADRPGQQHDVERGLG